ncbi:MAG: hypothetical protein PVI30_08105 [Myxococcales bacterium]|jgi:hypothetical protein
MKSSIFGLILAALLVAAPSSALASQIGKSLGNLRWGMSDTEVVLVVKRALKKEYAARFKKAKGAAKDRIKDEYKRRVKDFERSLVQFDGRSRWDNSVVGEDFTHNNNESMMVLEGKDSDNYYFFIEGRLWKWVKTLPASTFGRGNFGKFARSVKKKFGRGYEKRGEVNQDGSDYQFVEFLDRRTRLRAVDKTSDHGKYALMFEEMATVRNLTALRPNGTGRSKSRADKRRAHIGGSKGSTTARSARKGRRSIFSDGGGDESEAEYRERKRKVMAERERKARAIFKRKQEAKKGKVLDDLAGIEDDDPLAGVH